MRLLWEAFLWPFLSRYLPIPCAHANRRTGEERACENCDGYFYAMHTYITQGKARFCSRRCYEQGQGPRVPVEQRFWSKVDKTDDCWIWTAGRTPQNYGLFYYGPHFYELAHRAAYRLMYGAIPAGHYICHRCDNPPCVNPAHLFLGTAHDNNMDMALKGRHGRQSHHS